MEIYGSSFFLKDSCKQVSFLNKNITVSLNLWITKVFLQKIISKMTAPIFKLELYLLCMWKPSMVSVQQISSRNKNINL